MKKKIVSGQPRAPSCDSRCRGPQPSDIELLSNAFEASPTANSIADLDQTILRVNDSFLRIWGFQNQDEVIGKRISFLYADPRDVDVIFSAINGTGKWEGEFMAKRKDGSTFCAFLTGSVVLEKSGRRIGYQSSILDITPRKQMEESLRNERDFSDAVIDGLPGIFYCFDENLQLLRWNKSFERVTAYTSPEVARMSPLDFFAGPDKDLVSARIRDAFEKGKSEVETGIVTKEGASLPYHFHGKLAEVDGRRCLVGVGIDISAGMQARDDLRRTNMYLSSIVENIPNMLFLKEAKELRYIRINRTGEDVMGCPRGDLLGKRDQDLFPQNQADLLEKVDWQVLRGHQVVDVPEEWIQARDGNTRVLHTRKVPIFDAQGNPEFLLGISEDITQRKRAEEELRHVLSSARCILWRAEVSEKAEGGFRWDLRISNEEAAAALLPIERKPGEPYSSVWHRGISQEELAQMDRVSERAIREGKAGYSQEYRCQILNGEIRWLSEDVHIQSLGHGRWLIVGICTDITSRREAEEQLRRQLEELRRWYELTLGREGRVLELKQEVNQLLVRLGAPARYPSMGTGPTDTETT